MTNKPETLVDLLTRINPLGLDKSSTVGDVIKALGAPDEGWDEDNLLVYDDLEIAIKDSADPQILYFAVYPRKSDGEHLRIPGVCAEKIEDRELSFDRVLDVLKEHFIEWEFDERRDYKDEQKFVSTKLGDQLFFMRSSATGHLLLKSAFLSGI